MIILPAIDIKNGKPVRLFKGDFSTAKQVAEGVVETALEFERKGAKWVHIVDLDGALMKKRVNHDLVKEVAEKTDLKIEIGGGIRTLDDVSYYIENGASRVILGSVALTNPSFVAECVKKYKEKIAVGIDAKNGFVATEGWLNTSSVYFTDLAKEMAKIGVQNIIFTDISKDGTLQGPNFEQLSELKNSVDCNVIASGGIHNIDDIRILNNNGLYGAICGQSIYQKTLILEEAIKVCENGKNKTDIDMDIDKFFEKSSLIPAIVQEGQSIYQKTLILEEAIKVCENGKNKTDIDMDIDKFFEKSSLIPAIVQEKETGEVLMLAYMNKESFEKTLETGYTWFWSRSRQELWNKGATSGHLQKVHSVYGDCDSDTLLVTVTQTGNACHTGSHSCFFEMIKEF